jgi:DNA polymerase III epsilon subunit family exonuclease
MDNLWKNTFVVTDLETTGHDPKQFGIIEVACVIIKGGEITHEYSTLVNPKHFVPSFVSSMTGITNKMAANAPLLEDVIDEIYELFQEKKSVFVAHNVKFDWGFITEAFKKFNLTIPTMPQLCTNKLAKALMPLEQKKSVGALAEYFDIKMYDQHRALADARATAKILIEFIEMSQNIYGIYNLEDLLQIQNKRKQSFKLTNNTFKKLQRKLLDIPDKPGIYKFFDKGNKLIYIGKSKYLYKRVNSYFKNSSLSSRKMLELVNCIDDIKWEVTPSELSAMILEEKLLKENKPYFNKLNKESRKYPFIKITKKELFPKVILSYNYEDDGSDYYGPFRNSSLVEGLIQIIDKNFSLIKCELNNTKSTNTPCVHYHMGKCQGPCFRDIDKDDYFLEVENVSLFLEGLSNDIIGRLEEKMDAESMDMKYESAAKIRDQIKELTSLYKHCQNMPASINRNNFIFILPESNREKTVNIFYISQGVLAKEINYKLLSNNDFIFDDIDNIFFKNSQLNSKLNIEEIRIINSWLQKNMHDGEIILTDNKDKHAIFKEIESTLHNLNF